MGNCACGGDVVLRCEKCGTDWLDDLCCQNNALRARVAELESQVAHWKDVAQQTSDSYHGLRGELAEAAKLTERVAELEREIEMVRGFARDADAESDAAKDMASAAEQRVKRLEGALRGFLFIHGKCECGFCLAAKDALAASDSEAPALEGGR